MRPQGVGRLVMGEGEGVEGEGEECEIVTTVVVKEEKVEEKRMEIRSAREGKSEGGEGEGEGVDDSEGEGEEEDGSEPGEGEVEEPRRPVVPKLGLRLGLGLGVSGLEEAKDDGDVSTITVYAEEAKEGEGRPKLLLTSSSSSSHTPRLALSLPTSSSRPTTPQKGAALHLHAEEGSPTAAVDSSIIITTTTTTTTTTSTTQHMRLLPLVPTHHPTSAPFVPSKASNLSTTQSTSSRAAKLDYFLHDCTSITPDLFISGQIVASDSALLHRHGITHIVNACGAVCDNYFPDQFAYYRLYLQDKGSEDVLCILYDVFDFIRGAREKGGKTLIHCQQGVSRSTVLGIGYLMMAPDDSEGAGRTPTTRPPTAACAPGAASPPPTSASSASCWRGAAACWAAVRCPPPSTASPSTTPTTRASSTGGWTRWMPAHSTADSSFSCSRPTPSSCG